MKGRRRFSLMSLFNLYNSFLISYLLLRMLFGGAWWWLAFLNTFALWLFMPLLVMIPLALLLRGKYSAALSLLLAIAGLWKFAPVAHTPQSNAPHDLRVMSFNVWKDNEHIGEAVDWILAQDADILILQEFIDEHNRELPRLLAAYPFHITVEGNVKMLSRYPYIESELIVIEEPTDEHDGRIALRARLEIQGQKLVVYGVHLTLPRQEDFHFGLETEIWPLSFILRYDETRRNHQIRNLAQMISAESDPVILAGDFNASHTSTILDELRATGLVESFDTAGGDWGMTWRIRPETPPVLRIDYIWTSPELRALCMWRGASNGSDHLPVLADFALTENQ